MPKKKSVRRAAKKFQDELDQLVSFCQRMEQAELASEHVGLAYELAVIKLSAKFEQLILDALVGAINNDTSTISEQTGVRFPKHLTDEVCEYLIAQNGYLDFKGRDGLIQKLKQFVPPGHYLLETVSAKKYQTTLEQLFPLRNFAAHESRQAKRAATKATGTRKMGSVGKWLRTKGRFRKIARNFKQLAKDIQGRAPY